MDFNYKLARKNTELFKRDFAKGLRIDELQNIGVGTRQKAYLYKNLVIKKPIQNDILKCGKRLCKQYNDMLVKFSAKGIEQNLKFAPILDYVKDDEFCTISPYIDGTELSDCTNEQISKIGVADMKKYLANNLKLSSICLSPEFHDLRNFKLSEQGNLNVIDYSTWYFLARLYKGYQIKPYRNKVKDIEGLNEKFCSLMFKVPHADNKFFENFYTALKQTPHSNISQKEVEQHFKYLASHEHI